MRPRRLQRKRVTGWKVPEGAVYVGRGYASRWGNPFKIGAAHPLEPRKMTREDVIALYRSWLTELMLPAGKLDLEELRGKDLVCWCALDLDCHARVLLELANA